MHVDKVWGQNYFSFFYNSTIVIVTKLVLLFKNYLNRIPAMAVYTATFWGTFFTGAYFPQKSDLSPRIESKYKPFQKHVSSYILKRSLDSVVWSAPTLLRGALELFNEDNSLRGENTVADPNPARVKAQGGEMHTNYHKFKLIVVQ
jgi:hypothetical protein